MEKQTRERIAYQVLNNLTGGLQSVTNHPFSLEQMGDEMDNLRLELIKNPKISQQIDFKSLFQPIRCLDIVRVNKQDCIDIGFNSGGTYIAANTNQDSVIVTSSIAPYNTPEETFVWRTRDKIPRFLTIPGQPSVSYIGSADWGHSYRTVDMRRIGTLQYEKHAFPTAVWVDNHFYFFNIPAGTVVLGLIAAFERPAEVENAYDCCKDQDYPIPGELISTIVRTMVANYQNYGYGRNPQPNTQASIPQGGKTA